MRKVLLLYSLVSLVVPMRLLGAASRTVCNGTWDGTTCTPSGSTATNFPLQFGQPFVQGEIAACPAIVFDGSLLATDATTKQRYTADSSVKHAILAAVIPSIAPGTHTVTFANQLCSNAALSKAQMLASNFNFGAQIQLTNGSTVTGDARAMLNAWDGTTDDFNILSPVHLWTAGPIAQTILIALHGNTQTCNGHQCSTYDIGFDTNKAFRPIFHATFWPATNQVHVRYIGEIGNSETIEDQTYSLALTAGNTSPATVYIKASFTQSLGTRWTKDFWIGGTPPSNIVLLPNLAYLRTTKFVPYYDTTTPLNSATATTVSSAWANLAASSKDIGGTGNWIKNMTDAGSRPDIGVYESWVVDWLYDGRQGLRDAVFGNADLSASWPVHFREGKTGKILNRGDAGSTGMGKVVSLSGRQSMCINPQMFNYGASAADVLGTGVGSTTSQVALSAQGWNWDAAHFPEPPSVQYTLTGDYWYLEEAMFWTSIDVASGYRSIFYRGPTGAEGSLMYQQLRAMAWNLRTLVNTAFIIPDGQTEKTYFTTLVADSVAIEEGARNVTTGAYNGGALWSYGRNTMASNGAGTMFDSNGIASTLHQYVRGGTLFAQDEYGICSSTGAGTPCPNPTVSEAAPLFESDYMMTALGRCKELGYLCDSLLTWASSLYTGMLTDPGFNPYIMDNGRVPTYTTAAPPAQFSTFAQLKTGYNAQWQGRTAYATVTDPDGYLAYATAAVCGYMTGETNGPAACNFLQAHGMTQATFALDPKWHIIPSAPSSCSISPTSLPSGGVGVSYGTQTLTASNCGGGTLTWTITAGALPTGLSGCNGVVAPTCSITGTPSTAVGSPFSVTIRVSDGGTNIDTRAYSITITTGGLPVITSTSPLPDAVNGSPYSYQLTGSGSPTWSGTSIPTGLTLTSGGLLSGTPTITAVNTLAITATNGSGSTPPTNFSLTVGASGAPIILSTSPLPAGQVGTIYSFQFTAQ